MAVKTINETQLVEYSRCPLRVEGSTYRLAPELETGVVVADWLMEEFYEARTPSLADARSRFDDHWRESGHKRASRDSARISKRVHDLVASYHVFQPPTPYVLSFGRTVITGRYAVLVKPRRHNVPFVVRLRFHESAIALQPPDLTSVMRWLHFRFAEPGKPDVRVLNWSVDEDAHWTERFDETVSRGYLRSLADNLADNRRFPSVSEHCASCQSKACLEVCA